MPLFNFHFRKQKNRLEKLATRIIKIIGFDNINKVDFCASKIIIAVRNNNTNLKNYLIRIRAKEVVFVKNNLIYLVFKNNHQEVAQIMQQKLNLYNLNNVKKEIS